MIINFFFIVFSLKIIFNFYLIHLFIIFPFLFIKEFNLFFILFFEFHLNFIDKLRGFDLIQVKSV